MSLGRSDLDQPFKGGLPAPTEITFRLWSPRSWAFTAVVRDGCDGNGVSLAQLTQLIKGKGYAGEPDIFTIKPLQEESLLLTGICHYPAPQLLRDCPPTLPQNLSLHTFSNNVARSRHVHGWPVRAVAESCSTTGTSDDNSLGECDSDASNDDDGCRNEDEQDGLSTRSRVDPLPESLCNIWVKWIEIECSALSKRWLLQPLL
jgi:hypothetical protein